MEHDSRCKKYPQTPVKKLKREPSQKLIKEIQRTCYRSGENVLTTLPDDADTIPDIPIESHGLPARRYSRSEAIQLIKSWKLVLHRHEIAEREELIHEILEKVIGHKGRYNISAESSFSHFFSSGKNTPKNYREFADRIEKIYRKAVCPACLEEASFIWREMDMILRYTRDIRQACPCGDLPWVHSIYIADKFNYSQHCLDCDTRIIHPPSLSEQFQELMPCHRCKGFMRKEENAYACKCGFRLQSEEQYLQEKNGRKEKRKEKRKTVKHPATRKCPMCYEGTSVLTDDNGIPIYKCDKCAKILIPSGSMDKYQEIRKKKIVRVTDKYPLPKCSCGKDFVHTVEGCEICKEYGGPPDHDSYRCTPCDMTLFIHPHSKDKYLCSCGGQFFEESIPDPKPHDEYVCNQCRRQFMTWEQTIDLGQ